MKKQLNQKNEWRSLTVFSVVLLLLMIIGIVFEIGLFNSNVVGLEMLDSINHSPGFWV